jgi:hypothetical protein
LSRSWPMKPTFEAPGDLVCKPLLVLSDERA